MITLRPESDERQIPQQRDCASEFEVQAELWSMLRELGLVVRGEVLWQQKSPREHCRFDLVIYDRDRAIHIIEVKAAPVKHKNGLEATRQGRRYVKFGIPVTFIYGIEDARKFVREGVWR